jgi:hypothetical protein
MALICEACEVTARSRHVCTQCYINARDRYPIADEALKWAIAKIEMIQTLCEHGKVVSMNENHEWTLTSFVEELAEILGP